MLHPPLSSSTFRSTQQVYVCKKWRKRRAQHERSERASCYFSNSLLDELFCLFLIQGCTKVPSLPQKIYYYFFSIGERLKVITAWKSINKETFFEVRLKNISTPTFFVHGDADISKWTQCLSVYMYHWESFRIWSRKDCRNFRQRPFLEKGDKEY
ncbi:hypothetical protein Droror1_Dr00003040 [Drosera rotundifolia]